MFIQGGCRAPSGTRGGGEGLRVREDRWLLRCYSMHKWGACVYVCVCVWRGGADSREREEGVLEIFCDGWELIT